MSARRIPIGVAVGVLRAALPVAHTWRFRHPDDPTVRFRPALGEHVYATWHEHLLPLTWLFARQGVATLTSRDHDGEIIARLLDQLGYVTARGSSTRGGPAGFRQLSRAAKEGRPIILTSDGPRGPRRIMKQGTPRLAAHTQRGIVPMGVAVSAGWRLDSWDRFLVPAPGATVFVSFGPAKAGDGATAEDLEEGLLREICRCEQAASEARWARPPRVRRETASAAPGGDRMVRPSPAGEPQRAPPGDDHSVRADVGSAPVREGGPARRRSGGVLEARVRTSWVGDRPSPFLRPAAFAFSLARDTRGRLYDLGVFATFSGGLPVISVGGVTVGGSGKTPLVSHLSRFLASEGYRVAILTRGYPDELALHRRWCPEAMVWGHPDRVRLARRAAAEGATVAVLDDGFQHRRLRRDLDVLAVDRDALRRTHGASLPAGPFRERWPSAARRAGVIVITGREPWTDLVARVDAQIRAALRGVCPDVSVASTIFESGKPVAANPAARSWTDRPAPRLALTGIMKPNLFFDQAKRWCPSIAVELALRDHGMLTSRDRAGLDAAAGKGGVLTTHKDLPRLQGLFGASLPLWVLPERLVWREGGDDVRRGVLRALPSHAEAVRRATRP